MQIFQHAERVRFLSKNLDEVKIGSFNRLVWSRLEFRIDKFK
jgi:hypothetical protein